MSLKFTLIHAEKANHTIGMMTRVLQVSRAGYYAWVKRQGTVSPSQRRRDEVSAVIKEIDTEKRLYLCRVRRARRGVQGEAVGGSDRGVLG